MVIKVSGTEGDARKTTDVPMSNSHFRSMSLLFRIRDALRPRRDILEEVGLENGMTVLDYGCGPGSYSSQAAQMVWPFGKVYAADIHPLAVERIEKLAERDRIRNLETVQTDRATGLPDGSVDVVLLYDVLHDLSDPDGVLEELHRVLRPGGVLSVNDHHFEEGAIVSRVTAGGLFALLRRGKATLSFIRLSPPS